MTAAQEERILPRSTPMGSYQDADYLLTHAVWENSYGSYQPETGVRFARPDGKFDNFALIEHGWSNFATAERIIVRGLRKGWTTTRIADFIARLRERSQPKATIL